MPVSEISSADCNVGLEIQMQQGGRFNDVQIVRANSENEVQRNDIDYLGSKSAQLYTRSI